MELLQHRYALWQNLTKDFYAYGAKSFDELKERGSLSLRPGTQGIGAVSEILGMVAARYYSLCRSIIKKYDPGALYLGDRYISNYYPEVAQVAGRFCDVVSTNLNADWIDGGFVRFHLDTLEALTHRPLMVTEFYMTAHENGTGDPNNSSDFPIVQTQAERAKGFEKEVKGIASYPALVGAHWFQYYDEPQKGRGDGENYDFGLVDANNHPYEDLIRTAQHLNLQQVHEDSKPFQPSDSLPPAPDAWGDMTKWNRDHAFVPPVEVIARGDLYSAWAPDKLDVGLFWQEDLQNEGLYADGKVPDADRTIIQIEIPATHTTWNLRVVGKNGQVLSGPEWTRKLAPETSTHQSLLLQIPASAFGNAAFQSGADVSFNVRLISETKAYTTRWEVSRHLSN